MKKVYTPEERNEILDHVVAIANLVHESGIKIAIDLGLPDSLVSQLRDRAVRASQITDCECSDCNPDR